MDTGISAGKTILDTLGAFAEFETNLRRKRQLEGIKAAKARGIYKGRKPSIDPDELRRLRDEEKLGSAAIARRLGIGRWQRLSGALEANIANVVARHRQVILRYFEFSSSGVDQPSFRLNACLASAAE